MNPSEMKDILARQSGEHPDGLLARAMLARLRAGKDLRHAKIERVRSAILCNEYENSLKLEVAADRVVEAITPPQSV